MLEPQRKHSSTPGPTSSGAPRRSPAPENLPNPKSAGLRFVAGLAIVCALGYILFQLVGWGIGANKAKRQVAELSQSVPALVFESASLLNESPASNDAIQNLILTGRKHRSRFQFNSALRDLKQAQEMLMAIALRANDDSRAQRASLLASRPWLELLDISRSDQAAEELQKSTKALAAGLPIEAAAAARAALDLLNGASSAYDRARSDAWQESVSGQTLLWFPDDVGKKTEFSATRERLLTEYRQQQLERRSIEALFFEYSKTDTPTFQNGHISGPFIGNGLALKLLISQHDSLVEMPQQDVFRLILNNVLGRRRGLQANGSEQHHVMRQIEKEAINLAFWMDFLKHFPEQANAIALSPDSLLRGYQIRSALAHIARDQRRTIDSKVVEPITVAARAVISGPFPTNWPSSLLGAWQQSGTSYFALSGSPPRLFQIPEQADSPVEVTEDGAEPLVDHCQQIIGANSTIAASLFTVLPSGSNIVVQTPGVNLAFSPFEWELLRKGHPLPDRPDVERWIKRGASGSLVMYSHPLMNRAGPYRDLADDFCFALQKAYPNARVYRDPFSEKTTQTAAALNKMPARSAQDYVAIIAEDSFKVTDGRAIQNIRSELTDAGMKVVKVASNTSLAWEGERGKGVIVITGHSSADLARFVKQLGEAGMLRDNFIIFNSCQTPVTRELASQMVEVYGAEAAFVHEGVIKAAAVENLMVDLAASLKMSQKVLPDLLRELLRKNGLNGVWTICISGTKKRINNHISGLNYEGHTCFNSGC